MRKFIKNIFLSPAIPVGIILGTMLFSHSCANTTTPPSGGPKDTIPPVMVWIEPGQNSVNVPTKKTKLTFTFNEYVKVKNPKSIYLSPPLEKGPRFKMKGKSVVVYFENDLDSNTTYTLDLNDAIVDNNEGNPYPGYTLVFSTGKEVDTMAITGLVQDCNTLKPIKGATVMVYKDHADSALFKHRPIASAKTDEWGYFVIRNIQDTLYRLYAIKDENNNNLYNPESGERIAFIDSLIRPTISVNDSIPELLKFDMKDTTSCLARRAEYELSMFKEKPSKQMLVNKERVGARTAYITFMAPNTQIDSIWIEGMNPKRLITQFNVEKDSLEIWVNDQRAMPDTLHLCVDYMKTDTLGQLQPFLEKIKLTMDKPLSMAKSSRRNIKHEDTTCVVTTDVKPERVEQYGFEFEFKYPLVKANFDTLQFTYINPRQKEYPAKFTVYQDHLNLRKYTVKPNIELLEGYEYILKVPERIFMDINGHYNDSLDLKVSLPKDETLSSLSLNLSNVHEKYIVDLLNEKRSEILRSFIVDKDEKLVFPYLKAGKYAVRITEDINRNEIVDTGILLEHKQPEKVMFFKINGDILIEVPERMEINQDVDIVALFNEPQTTTESKLKFAKPSSENENMVLKKKKDTKISKKKRTKKES